MDGKYITGICTVFVAVLMVGGLLMPIIDHTTEGEPVINPDAGWIRMNYDTAASAYTINISASDDGITVSNGTDTQTGDDETIYYADSNLAVWLEDGYFTVLGQSTNGPVFFQSEDDITITRDSEGVTVTDGVNTVTVGAPAWAYVPYSSGSYGFFADGVAASTNNNPIVAVGGGFAGVYAYNNITRYAGLGLELQTVTEGGKITGAYWAKPSAEEPSGEFNPGSITPINPGAITGGDVDIQPIDPITINPEPDVSIMSVPTPTYTDGDWGYDLTTVDGVQKAIIVSYSGAGGDIVVPATVGGYEVYQFGKGGSSQNVIDNSSISANSTITFNTTGLKILGDSCLASCGKLVGDLTIPNTVTTIAQSAFSYCRGLDGYLTLPSSVQVISANAFSTCDKLNCNGLDLSNLTTLGTNAFQNDYKFVGTLKLPINVTSIPKNAFGACNFTGTLDIPDNITSIGQNAFGYNKFNEIIFHEGLTSIDSDAFYSMQSITEPIVIPSTLTNLGSSAFAGTYATDLIINSDFIPSATTAFTNSRWLEVLDLSDTVDYSVDRYGIPAPAEVQDNIGDSIGYLGAVYIPGESDLSPSAVALMYVIPAIILVSLIIFGAVVFVRRE